jgi:hypothetical protein
MHPLHGITCLTVVLLVAACSLSPSSGSVSNTVARSQAGVAVAGTKRVGQVPSAAEERIKQAISTQPGFRKLLALEIVAGRDVAGSLYRFRGAYRGRKPDSMFWPQYFTQHFEGQMLNDEVRITLKDKSDDNEASPVKLIGEVPASVEEAILLGISKIPGYMDLKSLEIRAGQGVTKPGGPVESVYGLRGAILAEKDSGLLPFYTRHFVGAWKGGQLQLEFPREKDGVVGSLN